MRHRRTVVSVPWIDQWSMVSYNYGKYKNQMSMLRVYIQRERVIIQRQKWIDNWLGLFFFGMDCRTPPLPRKNDARIAYMSITISSKAINVNVMFYNGQMWSISSYSSIIGVIHWSFLNVCHDGIMTVWVISSSIFFSSFHVLDNFFVLASEWYFNLYPYLGIFSRKCLHERVFLIYSE